MNLYMNNQEVISITKNSKHHSRTKHIDVQHYFVRELVQKEIIVSRYVKSRENTADILIKTLSRNAHETEMRMLEFANMSGHDQMTESSLRSERRC
jgi:hypothetical protein